MNTIRPRIRSVASWHKGDAGWAIYCPCGCLLAVMLEPGGRYQVLCRKCRIAFEVWMEPGVPALAMPVPVERVR